MAKILLGQMVGGISGSIAGVTYARNSNGQYARQKSIPVNTNTPAQQLARALFTSVSSSYRGLSEALRQAWRTAASTFPYVDVFGQSKIYTGNQLYMKLNQNLNIIGMPILSAPPAPVELPPISNFAVNVTVEEGDLALNINPSTGPGAVPAGFKAIVTASPGISQSISYVSPRSLKQIAIFDEGVDLSSQALEPSYLPVYGVPNIGTRVFIGVRFVSKDSGQSTLVATGSGVVEEIE
jgi:hypothetical protein